MGALSDNADTYTFRPLREALEERHATDAHHSLYSVAGETVCPRLNKPILADLPPGAVTVSVTALDWDTPGHVNLRPGEFDSLKLEVASSPLPQPTVIFATQHGARLLYFHQPLEPHDAESLHKSLVEQFATAGIPLDAGVWDWSRLHRLPKVSRDGKPFDTTLYFGPDLDATAVPRTKIVKALCPQTLQLPKPPESARELAFVPGARGQGLTDWAKEAKRLLADRLDGLLAPIFDLNPPALPEPRNPTIMRIAGCAAALTKSIPNTTPEHLYGLLLGSVHASTKPDGRDLAGEAWKMILYCWAREMAKDAQNVEQSASLLETVTKAILAWPDPPALPHDHASWICKRLIVSVSGKYFVLQADGQYSTIAHSSKHLYAALRDSGLAGDGGLIDISPEGQGDLSESTLLNRYHTPLDSAVELTAGPGRMWIANDKLKTSIYRRRTDIPATYDARVEEWLRLMFGPEHVNVDKWIGQALAIERGPTCALSVVGPPGSGKQMLADGLGECFTTQCVARASDFGAYQYGLLRSPIVVVDEGWPERIRNVADTFRQWVGGLTVEINRKYEAPQMLTCNPRVLLTANNDSVVRELCARKQLDWNDQAALQQRLHHVEITDDAAKHLAKRGGRAYTSGWVKGSDRPSDYVIAKHFLWLYEQHGQRGGAGRFLFEGKSDPAKIWALGVGADGVAEVGQALIAAPLLRDERGNPWVRTADVQASYHIKFDRLLSVHKIARLLKPFLLPSTKEKFRAESGWQRGSPVNMEKLEEFAEEHGLTLRQEVATC